MKKVHLFTENNHIIKERLAELDCRHLPFEFSGFAPGDIIVHQISNESLRVLQERLTSNPMCEHIMTTEEITQEQKDFFLKNGIACVIQTTDPEKISDYIKVRVSAKHRDAGKMLIYDDKKNTSAIIRTITSHFGCETVFADSTDGFFKSMTEGAYHFILINLGCAGLDIPAFVRGCHSHPEIKASPLIAYKDTTDGMFINELISGINRYISYILSPEEMYSFLLDILFKKEFISLIRRLNIESHFAEFSHFCDKPLNRIYYEAKDHILSLQNILDKNSILSILSAMIDIEKSLIGVSALNWLRISEEKASVEKTGYLRSNTPAQALNGQTSAANKL